MAPGTGGASRHDRARWTPIIVITGIHTDGVAVLLVEPNITQALAIAARAYILEQGPIVAEGASSALAQDASIREATSASTERNDPPSTARFGERTEPGRGASGGVSEPAQA